MHELAFTEAALRLVLDEAQKAGAACVTKVEFALGSLSLVVEDSVRFYWEAIAPGTAAAEADLAFRLVTPLARCRACRAEYVPEERDVRCPACGEAMVDLLAGDQFRVEAIEVE